MARLGRPGMTDGTERRNLAALAHGGIAERHWPCGRQIPGFDFRAVASPRRAYAARLLAVRSRETAISRGPRQTGRMRPPGTAPVVRNSVDSR
jgi:hypothetical protein